MTTVPEGAVKAGTLWAVNIHGPDDLIAAPDYMSAVRMANAFNAWWLNLKAKQPHNDALDARMWAVPTDWPGNDAQGHADELSKPHPEYQWLRDASALPHLPGVGVKTLPRAPKDQSDIGWTLPIHLLEELRKEADSWADEISIEGVEAIALSTERRILSALEPSTARELALEEAARKAQKAIAAILASGGLESDKWWDDLVSAQQSLAAAIRALSSPDHADAGKVEGEHLPQDVINLVIAAREAFDTGVIPEDEEYNLDKALEPFGERVPYENEPDALPSAPSQEVAGS